MKSLRGKPNTFFFAVLILLLPVVMRVSDAWENNETVNAQLPGETPRATATADYEWSTNRVGFGNEPCSKEDILVFQNPTPPLPNGIPTYTVRIENVCYTGNCTISNIHLSCGWFSSARFIPPTIFRRLAYDDCLVNDGQPVLNAQVVTFEYANTFPYHMAVSSISC